jgi:RNA recognition motif-containing protein
MRDQQTGRIKGFGFVKYSSQAEAEKAVKAMDGRVYAFCSAHLFLRKLHLLTDTDKLMTLTQFPFDAHFQINK